MRSTLLAFVVLSATVGGAFSQCGPLGCSPSQSAAPSSQPNRARTHPSIARIVHHEGAGSSVGSGTLVALSDDAAYFLTCAHLFTSPGRTEVQLAGQRSAARLLAIDKGNDLALLRTAPMRGRPVETAEISTTGLLTACGFGGSGILRCVRGPLTGRATAVGADAPSLRIRGTVRSGDSGGPLLDASGRLVAVVWGQSGGETYAIGGAPLRRLLARLPRRERDLKPVDRSPLAQQAESDAAWRRRIEQRIDGLAKAKPNAPPEFRPPSDVVRRDDLAAIDSRWSERFEKLNRELRVEATHPAGSAPAGLPDWSSWVSTLATLVGGGSIGVAAWMLLRRRRRGRSSRVERTDRETSIGPSAEYRDRQPVAVDSPPPPQRVVPETHFVSYERDSFARAHQWASEQLARKFPGSVEMLASLDSLIRQQLNGEGPP